jgi:hypothetical protein
MPANCVIVSPSLSSTRNSRSPVRSGSQSSSRTTGYVGPVPGDPARTVTARISSPSPSHA